MQRILIGFVVVSVLAAASARAISPADRCESAKLKAAGQYSTCRLKADATAVLRDAFPDHARCDGKLAAKWHLIESQAAGRCPSTGDQAGAQDLVADYTDGLAAALAGGALLDCPAELYSCAASLSTCQSAPPGQPVATGQTACFDTAGAAIDCAGTGQDGELQHGLSPSFTDNGDGTITDHRTGLTWERLGDDDSVHDKDIAYTWTNAVVTKIGLLNGSHFADHGDWRLPSVAELQTLASYGTTDPAVPPPFDAGCTASCAVASCSCTAASAYWTSTTYLGDPSSALSVDFASGFIGATDKAGALAVRGVRGGT